MDEAAHCTLYTEGDALYDAMLAAIARARRTVRMESYIFASDEVGTRFVDALVARARAGVAVRLRVDAAGSFGAFPAADEARLVAAGVGVMRCHRWTWRRPLHFQQRNHRKLLVVDEAIAFLGGFNIHRESSRAAYGETRWRDTHLAMTGRVAFDCALAFDLYGRRSFHVVQRDHAWVLPNRGLRGRLVWHRLIRRRFAQAHRRIWLTTPYFVPDAAAQRALCDAARRGVDARVLVPAVSDVPIAQWAARAAYSRLLSCGVRIFEYLPRVMHAKTIVVDDDWATVGTANFDYRSFFINDELNAIVAVPALIDALAAHFTMDLADSTEILLKPWSRRPWTALAAETVGWLARRWL